MSASCHRSQNGLIAAHAYSVLGVNLDSNRIIVRNPWGREEYYGPGSDQTDDGQFELDVGVFQYSFMTFTVLAYHDWFTTSSGRMSSGPADDNSFNIYNDEFQEVIITVDLAPGRMVE